ncbi:MAG: hypothetical protein QXG03_02890 [Halalkalicoccus sp.]
MSSNENGGSGGDPGPGTREVAHRLFACEFDAASLEYADSDEERAPKYVITPTGARVNRLFVVGVLTEVERVNEEVVRARVVDPTGAFVVYAGQYQPDALAFLERADPPAFVAVTGKANTFRPDDSDRVYTSVRPESVAEVDAETRDRWTVGAAEHTLRRIDAFARALETDEREPGSGIALAREEYGTTPAYLAALRETALDAARLVAGEVEEVTPPAIAPDEDDGRAVDLAALRTDLDAADVDATPEPADGTPDSAGSPTEADAGSDVEETTVEASAEPVSDTPDSAGEASAGVEADASESATSDGSPGAEDAPTATEASDTGEPDTGELGDFGVESDSTPEAESAADPESEAPSQPDAPDGTDGEMYEFDAEERAEIEAEFDMGFSSGNEVEEPGEADIDVPEPDESTDAGADEPETGASEAAESTDSADVSESEPAGEPEPDPAPEPESPVDSEEVDVEDRAMTVMKELADGDGADREAVIERVASEAGVAPEAVDDAIESALLSGRCYEPQDDVLKPI